MTAVSALIGWIDLAAAIVLVGGLVHCVFVADASFAGARAMRYAVAVLAGVLPLEFGLTVLRLHAVSRIGGVALVVDLLRTRWGGLWVLRLIGLAALAARLRPGSVALAGLGALWLMLRSFQGHAGAQGVIPAVVDWIHFLAAACWLGSLVQVALLGRALSAAIATRLSRIATFSVGALLPAGVYAAFLHLPSAGALVTTAYGRTLSAKLATAAALITLGVLNHFRSVPALKEGDASAAHHLLQRVRGEVVVALLVLLCTALLGVLAPPHPAAP